MPNPASLQTKERAEKSAKTNLYEAVIATTPADTEEKVMVKLPTFNRREGPCPWTPRAGAAQETPQRGDRCIVAITDTNEPWVIGWWPA